MGAGVRTGVCVCGAGLGDGLGAGRVTPRCADAKSDWD